MGAATHTGTTTIESGVSLLLAGTGTPLAASTSAFRIASGGTFNLFGRNATIGSLADVAGAGGTVINSWFVPAVLTIGNDNTSTSFSGTLQDGGFGTLALTKIGTGTQTLSGANTYTGATTVNAGGLIVNGSIASSSGVTVNAGATVGGTGTLPSTTINGGTLRPASPGNSIGTITINGNLVFGAGSVYRVDVSRERGRPHRRDRQRVACRHRPGELRTRGWHDQHLYDPRRPRAGATARSTRCRSSILPSARASPTRRSACELKLISQVGQLITGTPNQEALAAAHDAAFNAGLPAFSALHGLSAAQLPAALDQLSGEVHASTAGVLVDESRYVRNAVLGRLRQASYGSDARMAALSLGGPQTAFADGELDSALAYAQVAAAGEGAAHGAGGEPRHRVLGARASARGAGSTAMATPRRVRRDLAGFFTGVDTRIGGNGRAGIAAGYTGSRNNTDGRGSANVETGHLAAYGGFGFGAFKLRGGGAFPGTPSIPIAPLRSRASSIARRRTTPAVPARSSARSATALRSAVSRWSRSPGPPGCISTPTRRPSARPWPG